MSNQNDRMTGSRNMQIIRNSKDLKLPRCEDDQLFSIKQLSLCLLLGLEAQIVVFGREKPGWMGVKNVSKGKLELSGVD